MTGPAQQGLRLPDRVAGQLRSPVNQRPLTPAADGLHDGTQTFPVIGGVPVLIDEQTSIFRLADFIRPVVTTLDIREESVARKSSLSRWINHVRHHWLGLNYTKARTFDLANAVQHIVKEKPDALILIIGAGDLALDAPASTTLVYSDVAIGALTGVVFDAHAIPFADNIFDAVIATAVFQHVADPQQCVSECTRVLKNDGFIYADTSFMQQVVLGAYDYTRFTALGHRRLFRWFDEIAAGPTAGTGTVLSWSLEHFLTSFSENRRFRAALGLTARILAQGIKRFDRFTLRKRGTMDAASGFYFFGRQRATPLGDRWIAAHYAGMSALKPDLPDAAPAPAASTQA